MANPNPKVPKAHCFKKGQPRPKGAGMKRFTPTKAAAREHFDEVLFYASQVPYERLIKLWKNPTSTQLIVMKLVQRGGKHGNIPAIKEFNDRVRGRAPQEITGKDGRPLMPGSSQLAALPPAVLEKLLKLVEDEQGETTE